MKITHNSFKRGQDMPICPVCMRSFSLKPFQIYHSLFSGVLGFDIAQNKIKIGYCKTKLFLLLPFFLCSLFSHAQKQNGTPSPSDSRQENPNARIHNLIHRSENLSKQGKYKEACDNYNEGIRIKDSLENEENEKKIAQLSQQYNTYKERVQKELIEKDLVFAQLQNERRNIIAAILIILLSSLSVFIILMIRRIWKKNITKQKLNQEIFIKESDKGTKEKTNVQNQEDILEQKHKELMSNMLFLMKANEVLRSVNEEFKRKSLCKDEGERMAITKGMAVMLQNYQPDKGWEEFKLYFEKIHQSFYSQLHTINPELSQLEERLCALVALNMNASGIAELTNRSVRTIETAIYGIRKKLGIPKEVKTVIFLRQFLE